MTTVHTREALRSPAVCEWSVSAKNKVLPYMARSRRAPQAARIRRIFFMRSSPFREIINGGREKIKSILFENGGK